MYLLASNCLWTSTLQCIPSVADGLQSFEWWLHSHFDVPLHMSEKYNILLSRMFQFQIQFELYCHWYTLCHLIFRQDFLFNHFRDKWNIKLGSVPETTWNVWEHIYFKLSVLLLPSKTIKVLLGSCKDPQKSSRKELAEQLMQRIYSKISVKSWS